MGVPTWMTQWCHPNFCYFLIASLDPHGFQIILALVGGHCCIMPWSPGILWLQHGTRSKEGHTVPCPVDFPHLPQTNQNDDSQGAEFYDPCKDLHWGFKRVIHELLWFHDRPFVTID